VESASECGNYTTPDNEALKLASCPIASQDENASVSNLSVLRWKNWSNLPTSVMHN
jgi:hypothetical protein